MMDHGPWISPSQKTARRARTAAERGAERQLDCLSVYRGLARHFTPLCREYDADASQEDAVAAPAAAAVHSASKVDGPLQMLMLAGAALWYASAGAGQPVACRAMSSPWSCPQVRATTRWAIHPLTSILHPRDATGTRFSSWRDGFEALTGRRVVKHLRHRERCVRACPQPPHKQHNERR